MDYRRFGDKIIVRMDRGEEILTELQRVAEKEKILLASVTALGATDDFTVGVYSVPEKKYDSHSFQGAYEIVSLTGTINTMNGAYYAHLHLSAGDDTGAVFGGHLNRAVISATCEMVITVISGQVDRVRDESTGINVFRFD